MMKIWKSVCGALIDWAYILSLLTLGAFVCETALLHAYFWAIVASLLYGVVVVLPSDGRRDKAEKPV